MSILSKVNKFLTKTVGINISKTTPATDKKLAGDNDILPELLASSDNMDIGDKFVKSTPNNYKNEKTDSSKKSKKAVRREVLDKYGVSRWSNFWYNAIDLVRGQDLQSVLRRKYHLSKGATKEEYIQQAHKYINEQFEGLTEKEIAELYTELKEDFAKDIINNSDDELLMAIYAAILGDFDAASRTEMANDMLGVSGSKDVKTATAKELFDNAEYNMTTPDALGNVPDKEDATEYFSCVFENMTKEDVEIALNKLSMKADEVEPRIKELLAKENRTPEEEVELQKLQLLHENIIAAGLAGGGAGIMSNQNIDTEDLDNLLGTINATAAKHDILEEVDAAIDKYLKAHPEKKEQIETLRKIKLEEYIEELRTGFLSKTDPKVKTLTDDENPGNRRNITEEDEVAAKKQKSDREKSVADNKVQNHANASSKGNSYSDGSRDGSVHIADVSNPQNGLSGEKNHLSSQQNATENLSHTVASNPTYIRTTQECREFLRQDANGVKKFITGKIQCDGNVENMFIQEYKLKGKEQGEILAVSLNKYYNKLEDVTKTSAIRSFFAAGGKGINVDRTRAMQKKLEKDEEKSQNYNFTPALGTMHLA